MNGEDKYKSPIEVYVANSVKGKHQRGIPRVGQLRNYNLDAIQRDIDYYSSQGETQKEIMQQIQAGIKSGTYNAGFWKNRARNLGNVLRDIAYVTTHPIKALKGTHPIVGLKKTLGVEDRHIDDKLSRYEQLKQELTGDDSIPRAAQDKAQNLVKLAKYGKVVELMYGDHIIGRGRRESLDRGLRKRIIDEEKGLANIVEGEVLGRTIGVVLLAIATFSLVNSIVDNPSITGYSVLGISQATNPILILNLLAFVFVLVLIYPNGNMMQPTKVKVSRRSYKKRK